MPHPTDRPTETTCSHEPRGGGEAREQPSRIRDWIWHRARRVVVLVIGGTVLVFGVVMMVTPGPGVVGILTGLAILAAEFAWARRLLKQAKRHLREGGEAAWNYATGRNNARSEVPPGERRGEEQGGKDQKNEASS